MSSYTPVEWEVDEYERMRKSRRRAWLVSGASWSVAILSLIVLLLILPLKEVTPFLLTHDPATGIIDVIRPLNEESADLRQDEAVTISYIHNYILQRETIDFSDNKYRQDWVSKFSTAKVFDEYENYLSVGNENTPFKKYRLGDVVKIKVNSIQFLNEKTARIDFTETERLVRSNTTANERRVVILKFTYVPNDLSTSHRFVNPLGFIVTSYRKDAVSL